MIRVEKTHLPVAALTHPGMKGKNNEDRFGVAAFKPNNQPSPPILLAILSDGIGGHRAGEIASELAVNTISQFATNSDEQNPRYILEQAIIYASAQIFHQAQSNREQAGMGATCACAWIAGDQLYTATVGDSRIYLMRGGKIMQISTDHTWIQEALDYGIIQPDQVNNHPNAHVIRRYLGSPTPPEVDFRIRLPGMDGDNNQGLFLLPGDRLLLCSDGLTDLVNNDEILTEFEKESLEEAGQRLVDLANERGGHDNITLVAIQVPEVKPEPGEKDKKAQPLARSRSLIAGCLVIIAAAILVGAAAGGWLLFINGRSPTPTASPAILASLTSTSLPSISPTLTQTATLTRTQDISTPTQTATHTPPPLPVLLETITPVRLHSSTPNPTVDLPIITTTPSQ